MARSQLKFTEEWSASDHVAAASPLLSGTAGAASPARALQDGLLVQAAPVASRWPVGQRVALIATASLALWTAILHASAGIVHAVA